MEHTLFDDFKIYNTSLSELQVKEIARQATSMQDDGRYEGIADLQDFENFVNEVRNWCPDTNNSELLKAFGYANQALKNGTNKLKLQRYEELQSAVAQYKDEQLQLANNREKANLTFLITNSSFTRYNVGWQGADAQPLQNGTYEAYTDETAEQFSRPFDVWQLLKDLPKYFIYDFSQI